MTKEEEATRGGFLFLRVLLGDRERAVAFSVLR